jgi:hypothetical protein
MVRSERVLPGEEPPALGWRASQHYDIKAPFITHVEDDADLMSSRRA